MKYAPRNIEDVCAPDGTDSYRRFGPAYDVVDPKSGLAIGVVWREATVDLHEREIKVWWWAKKPNARVKVLVESGTRAAAARLLCIPT